MTDTQTTVPALLSPYACAGVVNKWLEADGVQKKLPPQMFYQYTSDKKKYIPVVLDEKGKRCVAREDLKAWYDKYTGKNKPVAQQEGDVEVDENQLSLLDLVDDESDES